MTSAPAKRAASSAPPVPGPPDAPSSERFLAPALAGTTVALIGLLVWGLRLGGGDPTDLASTGLADAGPLVAWSQPVVTLAGRIAAVGTVGTLLLAAVLLPGRRADLPATARRAAGAASWWALAWAGATALGGMLSLSRLVGVPPTDLTWPSVEVFIGGTGTGRAAALVVGLVLTVSLGARRCAAPGAARLLLVAALAALLLPVVLSGHSSGAGNHVLAAAALGVHVMAAAVWVGGLLALLAQGRRSPQLARAVARFSPIALGCLVLTAASGVVAAWAVLGGGAAVAGALGSGYGALLVTKTAGLLVLALFGRQHRRRTLPRLRGGEPGSFRRFAVGELLVMLATLALAVALASSPPPAATSAGSAAGPAAGLAAVPAPAAEGADPMAGHDHGELSVGVLVDDDRFHVAGPVPPGSRVTVHNAGTGDVSLTAADGSFDVDVPSGSLITFRAPERPGSYPFGSAHSPAFDDVLVVR